MMALFKELDPDIIRRAVQGHEDVLGPAHIKQEAFYRQFQCPRCKCSMDKEFKSGAAFDGESLVARALLRCPLCNLLLAPNTILILENGRDPLLPDELR